MEAATLMSDEPEPPNPPPPEAAWTIVIENMGLVYKLARQHSYNPTDFNDLVQEGLLGLLEAARRFDPSRQIAFSTYAYPWVLNKIMAVFQDRDNFQQPPEEEVEPEDWAEPNERALDSHEIEYIRQDLQKHLREHLATDLDDLERLVIAMRWLAPDKTTLQEIAEALGYVSHSDVHRIEQNALKKLRMGLSKRRK
jgi:RNA polymerase sigma factor (sigma-70 family)